MISVLPLHPAPPPKKKRGEVCLSLITLFSSSNPLQDQGNVFCFFGGEVEMYLRNESFLQITLRVQQKRSQNKGVRTIVVTWTNG